MFKTAFVTLVCACYLDTVWLVAGVAAAVLALERQAARQSALSSVLQVVLALAAAAVVRWRWALPRWAVLRLATVDTVPQSTQRAAIGLVLYAAAAPYNMHTTQGFPSGVYAAALLVAVAAAVGDLVVVLERAHKRHVDDHEQDAATAPRHMHHAHRADFLSVPVMLLASAAVVLPELVARAAHWYEPAVPVALVVGVYMLSSAMNLLP